MALRAVTSFKGEIPLVTPRSLPAGAAQSAVNARLFTGDLTPFKQFMLTKALANAGPVHSIALLDTYWISFDEQVDIARGIIVGDTTFRTYLTGLDLPRYTNLDLATGTPNGTGVEPYPVETRPIGVPGPDTVPTLVVGVDSTPTTFSIDIFDDCSDLTTNWVTTPQINAGDTQSETLQETSPPRFRTVVQNNNGAPAAITRDFGSTGASVVQASWNFEPIDGGGGIGVAAGFLFACGTAGDGARIILGGDQGTDKIPVLQIALGSALSDGRGSVLASDSGPGGTYSIGQTYTVTGLMNSNVDGTQTLTATAYLGSVQLCTVTVTNVFTKGGLFGPVNAKGDDQETVDYSAILVQASGANGVVITQIATSYVFTFVNDIAEESEPSLPSATIVRPDGVTTTVQTQTTVPAGLPVDYNITTKRIYRAATGSSATAFRFVAEIPLDQPFYVDTLVDTQLGEELQSDDWALPPDDLSGILTLPNGVMAGFSKNQLCLSAQNFPHAWPIANRLTTDTNIVGIGNIDTTVVIGTGSFVYTGSGNDPASYSMSKFEVPHAASSKLSFAYITGLGVVFSGPQGLMVCSGPGALSNLTEAIFTLEQWTALNPASIVSVAHNDIYFMFWEAGSNRGCYAVDLTANGFGVVEMAFHASAAYVDPIEDVMYLVLDSDSEPDDAMLPIRPTLPASVDGKTIYQFDADPHVNMTYLFRTRLWLEPYPTWFPIAQVRSETYVNTVFRIYGDGELLDEIVVSDEDEFTTTPPDAAYKTFEMEVLGTDIIRIVQAADDVTVLDGVSAAAAYGSV